MIENLWSEMDAKILDCLKDGGPMSPAELGRRAGLSESETTAFLAQLLHERRVRIHVVEAQEKTPALSDPSRLHGGESDRRTHAPFGW